MINEQESRMTNIDDRLREQINRYNALQQRDGPKNRFAHWEDYHHISMMGPKGYWIETIDGTILPAVPDSEDVIDAFVNLAIEATLTLGETYFSGVKYLNMCKKPLGSNGLPKIRPVKEGKQLVHCHLWKTKVDFSDFIYAPDFYPIYPKRQEQPIASVYLPRPKEDGLLLPGISLVRRIQQDGSIIGDKWEHHYHNGVPGIDYRGGDYVTKESGFLARRGQAYIERLVRRDITGGKNE